MTKNRFTLFDNKPFGIRAVGIVIHNDQILIMRRVRNGQDYYVLPGGGVDLGETVQQSIVREIFEETNQRVTVDHILYHLDFIDDSDQYFGLCRWVGGGEVKLNGEEAERFAEDNQYHPQWMPLADLARVKFLPSNVRDWLLADLPAIQNGEKPFRHERGEFIRQAV